MWFQIFTRRVVWGSVTILTSFGHHWQKPWMPGKEMFVNSDPINLLNYSITGSIMFHYAYPALLTFEALSWRLLMIFLRCLTINGHELSRSILSFMSTMILYLKIKWLILFSWNMELLGHSGQEGYSIKTCN